METKNSQKKTEPKPKDPINKNPESGSKSLDATVKNIFSYKPFADNDVLTVMATEKTAFMLLRNGIVLSWGQNWCTLGRKLADSTQDSYIPMAIKFGTKIVDLACGNNHCLARGANFKVYSWGNNSHGQVR